MGILKANTISSIKNDKKPTHILCCKAHGACLSQFNRDPHRHSDTLTRAQNPIECCSIEEDWIGPLPLAVCLLSKRFPFRFDCILYLSVLKMSLLFNLSLLHHFFFCVVVIYLFDGTLHVRHLFAHTIVVCYTIFRLVFLIPCDSMTEIERLWWLECDNCRGGGDVNCKIFLWMAMVMRMHAKLCYRARI